MRGTLPKLIKWNISAFFLIWGLYFFQLVESSGNIRPMILGVFCLGIVYWLFKAKTAVSWQITAASAAVLIAAATAAIYSGVTYGIFGMSYHFAWIGWTVLIGTPVMSFIYQKFS